MQEVQLELDKLKFMGDTSSLDHGGLSQASGYHTQIIADLEQRIEQLQSENDLLKCSNQSQIAERVLELEGALQDETSRRLTVEKLAQSEKERVKKL